MAIKASTSHICAGGMVIMLKVASPSVTVWASVKGRDLRQERAPSEREEEQNLGQRECDPNPLE